MQHSLKIHRTGLLCAALLLCAMTLAPLPLAAQKPYRILDRWQIGGEGGWDYMTADGPAHRLYLAHGPRVDVVDTASGKLIGSITGLYHTHGVALDSAGKFGYISDGGGDAVIVFDRSTLATVATIPAGENPDGIVFEPATRTVWAFNGRSHSVTVIDARTQKVRATIPLPGRPEFPAVDGRGVVFDNIEDKSEIVRIDARSRTITAIWPAGCNSPSGLAMDAAGRRLFPVCDGKQMSVIDARSGKLLANPSIGSGPDAARWSARRHLVFASSGDGILSVIDAAAPGYPTIESLPTQRGARTMAYDPVADRAYVVTAEFGPAPAATAASPHPRPSIFPGTFTVIVIGR
ncbi:MAG TPA: YncE family protein [Terracidiphilus sp.]|nr:YncE family protein [Terracidiphilus sp.]